MAEQVNVAYVFPGQGAQWVGMGRDLYDNFDSAKAVFKQADEALGFSLSRLCFEGPEAELRQTINAQPAIITVSLACLKAIYDGGGSNGLPPPVFVAGHSLGAHFVYGDSVRTILDIGGQDAKAIICDSKGRVTNFLMNDKCAAGTGRGIEVFAELVRVPIEQAGERSLQVEQEPPMVSSTCVVFAKSEALTLLRQGWNVNAVLAAYLAAMAHRTVELLQRLGIEKELVFTGGVSKNIGLVKRVEREIGAKALEPRIDPQIAGGIGAALFAKALVEKSRKVAV